MPDTSPSSQPEPGHDGTDPEIHARRLHNRDRPAQELGIELTDDVTVTRTGAGADPDAPQLVALFRGQAHELRPAVS